MLLYRRLVPFAAVLLLAMLAQGCSIFGRENRRTLNYLDDHVHFDSTAAKIAAAPAFIVVGAGAALADVAVVHPIVSVPKAADDTWDVLWDYEPRSAFHESLLFVPKVAATPLFFASAWTFRSIFGGL